MNELNSLQSMGLTIPSPPYFIGSVIFGILGYLSFMRGRKMGRSELTWAGLALTLYPIAVTDVWLLWVIGAFLTILVFFKWN